MKKNERDSCKSGSSCVKWKLNIFYTVLIFTIRTEDFAEIQDILSNDIHGILARIYLGEATSYR